MSSTKAISPKKKKNKRPKVLVLTSRFPFPLDKGDKLRLYYQLRDLSKRVDIHLMCISEHQPSAEAIAAVEIYCKEVVVAVYGNLGRWIGFIPSLFKGIPFQVGYFHSAALQVAVDRFIKEQDPDHIHCHLIRTLEYVRGHQDRSISLDFMDAFALGMSKREQTARNPLWKLAFAMERKRLYRYERAAFDMADRYCIISEQDRDELPSERKREVAVIPNGVDLELFKPKELDKQYDLLFFGNLAYPPNIAAIEYMVVSILPTLRKSRPETTLVIAGYSPSQQILSLRSDTVTVLSDVDDITEVIGSSRIMLAPMVMSIGLQNKIIQAMAMAVPCIVTRSASKPIGAQNDEQIIEVDSPEEFSDAIVALLTDEAKAKQIGEAGCSFVQENFSWEKVNGDLLRLFRG